MPAGRKATKTPLPPIAATGPWPSGAGKHSLNSHEVPRNAHSRPKWTTEGQADTGAEQWSQVLGRVERRVRPPATTDQTVGTCNRSRPVPWAGCSGAAPALCNKETQVDSGRWTRRRPTPPLAASFAPPPPQAASHRRRQRQRAATAPAIAIHTHRRHHTCFTPVNSS